ncbi:MAG: hypothetical protein K6G33_10830 [Ruminococcus sp.]|uniref:hypothetical protein n=1 Tax=Ruminococcus sp. TaxID=41978 RepID=UPI0025D8EB44|nr:hypothetical protein [Ruminococcus sp.]MCR5601219.1 hypothetical protein [Ruminococcus sp.]
MSIWWYFATIACSVGVMIESLCCINLLRGILRHKEAAIVINLPTLLIYFIAIIVEIILAIFNKDFSVPWILMTVIMLLSVLCLCVPLTPEGIVSAGPLKSKLIPREEYSYEFSKDKMGDCVKIYRNGASRPAVFHLGIKNMKTVKMLADWYSKHDYENPLTK